MKILSFGEIIWDVYPDNAVIGGAPLNFCSHCIRCGLDGYMLSAVGSDSYGKSALTALEKLGVKTYFVQTNNASTGRCDVTLDANMIPSYDLLKDTSYDFISFDSYLADKINNMRFDALYFGTLAQRGKTSRECVMKVLDSCSFSHVFCDLNLRDGGYDAESLLNCLKHATILKFSEEEEPKLGVYDFWKFGTDDMTKKSKTLFAVYPRLEWILFTKGAKGADIYGRKGEIYSVPAVGSKVVSTVGAGDSFGAAWLGAYLSGKSAEEAAKIASRVSGFVVSVKEAAPMYNIKDFT